MRPRPCPLWFVALVALVVRAVLHVWNPHAREAPELQLALFGWLVLVAQAVWAGIQAGTTATVAFLEWAVGSLWIVLTRLFNGLTAFGGDLLRGFRHAWGFLEKLYEHVLKPAWVKFWRLIDATRRLLERVFGPVVRFLQRVRSELVALYEKFVRPVLDTIDLVRKVVQLFEKLGFEWAAALDQKLAAISDWIYEQFAFVLRKVNEAINIIDRVITADGLFQRLALIRSIERDIRYVRNAFVNAFSRPVTEEDYKALRGRVNARTVNEIKRDIAEVLERGSGYYAPLVNETVANWRLYLEGRQ
jgi:hypothetical protein